ncbi:MAG: hypothetical protein HFG75_07275 [Hungatella sp.]|nr:hypothetical protein [Hungatella sp.]
MLGLFEKKRTPEEQLEKCLEKKDWDGLARAYYDLGTAAMEKGDLNKAVLWLNRADSVYSASDDAYEKSSKNRLFHKEIVTDCSDRIGALEDEDLLYNKIPAEMEEKTEGLADAQARILGLLSMARLVRLGKALSQLPGCEVLGELGWAADVILKSFQEPITQEEYGRLMDVCNDLYEFGDTQAFYAGGQIPVPGGAPFQVFDLNGMMGVQLELNMYIDNHLRFLSALSQGQEPPEPEVGMVGCTLLPDYYVRTGAEDLEQVPQIKAELRRIWGDFDFVCSRITWEQVARRVKEYQALDLLGETE